MTLSRVLSAVGYHQPPVYFLPTFTLTEGELTLVRFLRAVEIEPHEAIVRLTSAATLAAG